MRRFALLTAAAALSSGCFIEPDCAAPPDFSAYGTEAPAVAETDAFIRNALREAGPRDGAARALGFSGGAELAAIVERGCVEDSDVERFAAARGLTAATADNYLSRRFGARSCAGSVSSARTSSAASP